MSGIISRKWRINKRCSEGILGRPNAGRWRPVQVSDDGDSVPAGKRFSLSSNVTSSGQDPEGDQRGQPCRSGSSDGLHLESVVSVMNKLLFSESLIFCIIEFNYNLRGKQILFSPFVCSAHNSPAAVILHGKCLIKSKKFAVNTCQLKHSLQSPLLCPVAFLSWRCCFYFGFVHAKLKQLDLKVFETGITILLADLMV